MKPFCPVAAFSSKPGNANTGSHPQVGGRIRRSTTANKATCVATKAPKPAIYGSSANGRHSSRKVGG
jgi:hypothetical protein